MSAPRKAPGAARWEALASRWARHGSLAPCQSARGAVALGVQLLMLKDATAPGTWRDSVNAMGIKAGTASSYMALAQRFADAPDNFFDAIGDATKMAALLPLKNADDLINGGEMRGLTIELIRSMTANELREAVQLIVKSENTKLMIPFLEPTAQALPVVLSVEEERMLRLFRQCRAPAREALFGVARLLARP